MYSVWDNASTANLQFRGLEKIKRECFLIFSVPAGLSTPVIESVLYLGLYIYGRTAI
jgi:hypothetical protein